MGEDKKFERPKEGDTVTYEGEEFEVVGDTDEFNRIGLKRPGDERNRFKVPASKTVKKENIN